MLENSNSIAAVRKRDTKYSTASLKPLHRILKPDTILSNHLRLHLLLRLFSSAALFFLYSTNFSVQATSTISNLLSVLERLGKYEEAEAMHRRVLKRYEKVLGSEHPYTLTSMANLALTFWSQDRWCKGSLMSESFHVYKRAIFFYLYPLPFIAISAILSTVLATIAIIAIASSGLVTDGRRPKSWRYK